MKTNTNTNIYYDLIAKITPKEFEKFCLDTLKAFGEEEGLSDFDIKHNETPKTFDGSYQIDVLAEFTALKSKIKVLVECKKLSNPVKRDLVMLLYVKIMSIGANKGILISTSGFQSGAIKFAESHGISLWQICNNEINHVVATCDTEFLEKQQLIIAAEKYLPKYHMLEWDLEANYPFEKIYPTKEMYKAAMEKVQE